MMMIIIRILHKIKFNTLKMKVSSLMEIKFKRKTKKEIIPR